MSGRYDPFDEQPQRHDDDQRERNAGNDIGPESDFLDVVVIAVVIRLVLYAAKRCDHAPDDLQDAGALTCRMLIHTCTHLRPLFLAFVGIEQTACRFFGERDTAEIAGRMRGNDGAVDEEGDLSRHLV